MPLEVTELRRDPENRIYVHCYDTGGSTMMAGERIQVRVGTGGSPETILDATVPAGKQWKEVHFQFQAEEVPA